VDWGLVFGAGAIIPWLNAGIRLAMPTACAAAGETFAERAGILNLGLEGMMLFGALGSFLVAFATGNTWLGFLVAPLIGAALALIMALFSIKLKTEQVVNGIAIVLFAGGFTSFLYQEIFQVRATPPHIEKLPVVKVPLLGSIPGIGTILFNQNVLVYVAVALIALVWLLLFRTRFGLAARAVGESPASADAAGVRVDRIRTLALLVSGAMAGVGGAVLVIAQLGFYQDQVTAGRGWIAIALVYFSRWNPAWALGGALLFGITDALQLRIQAAGGGFHTPVPFEVFQALPYMVTVVVLVLAVKRQQRVTQPAALGVAYEKEAVV
jgi:simple sugar transport system permease protein